MNKNATAWVERLETTDEPQTTHFLDSEEGRCCLGIACDMYAKEHPDYQIIKVKKVISGYYMEYGTNSRVLPLEIQDWLGLISDNGALSNGACLSSLNDHGSTFVEIAEIIKKNESKLFVKE